MTYCTTLFIKSLGYYDQDKQKAESSKADGKGVAVIVLHMLSYYRIKMYFWELHFQKNADKRRRANMLLFLFCY